MIQSQRKFKEEDKDEDPASSLCSWNFWEIWTSLATWEQTGSHAFGEAHHSPCYLLGREVECCMNDWQSWAFYWAALKKKNGLSSSEILRSSHGRYESSLELDPSWNAKSLIQADALPWPRNLGKRHCDKVASYVLINSSPKPTHVGSMCLVFLKFCQPPCHSSAPELF